MGKAAELAEEGGCKLIRLAARRTAERTAIRPLAWKKDEGERLRVGGDEAVRVVREALRPLQDALREPLPFIIVRSVGELLDALQPLTTEQARLDRLQRQVAEWWSAVKRHLMVHVPNV